LGEMWAKNDQGSQRVPGLCITAMQFFNRINWRGGQ